jgi:cobalt transporter subunit CbtA
MIVRYLLAALAAGLISGLLMTPVQYTRTIPLILAAEEYEPGGAHYVAPAIEAHQHVASEAVAPEAADDHHQHEVAPEGEAKPLFLGRIWNTVFANLIAGVGFGLLLAGVSLALGKDVTANNGMIWGIVGWLAVQLLPALGLPPALPGFPEVDVDQRQIWWTATIIASVIGIALIALRSEMYLKLLGLVLLALPHLYGAPQPVDVTSAVPAFYAAEYTVASLATTLFFWLVLGLSLGWFMDRTRTNG